MHVGSIRDGGSCLIARFFYDLRASSFIYSCVLNLCQLKALACASGVLS